MLGVSCVRRILKRGGPRNFRNFEKNTSETDRRVARIWKRGGYFERVRSVQTTLTRIFIDLESVSDGLSET